VWLLDHVAAESAQLWFCNAGVLVIHSNIILLSLPVSPAWGLGEGLTTPHHKKTACYEVLHMPLAQPSNSLSVLCE